MSKNIFTWVAAVATVIAGQAALAGPAVNLGTGYSLVLESGSTGSITLAATNAGDATAEANFYSLALMVVQTSGTGTLTLSQWSEPLTNRWLNGTNPGDTSFDPTDPPTTQDLIAPVNIDGTDYYTYFGPLTGADNNGLNWPLIAGATKNIGVLTFQAGPEEGPSSWDIYAVNQGYTLPQFPVTFFANAALTPSVFANLLGEDGSFVKLGTVSVVAPVPEPSTMSMAGFAILAAGWAARRRLRDKA